MTLPTHAHFDSDTLPAVLIGLVFPGTWTDDSGAEQPRYSAARLRALPDAWYTRPMLWTGSAFADDVASERARLIVVAQAARDAVQSAGCDTPKGRVQTDLASRTTINAFYSAAIGAKIEALPYSVLFTMEDNSKVAHNADEMIALGGAVVVFFATAQAVLEAKRAALNAATTLDALWAIVPRSS